MSMLAELAGLVEFLHGSHTEAPVWVEPYVLTGQLEQSEALVLPFTLLVAPRGQLFERRRRKYENTKIRGVSKLKQQDKCLR